MRELFDFAFGVVDLDSIYTNDVGATLRTYGVEAARATIFQEVQGVFNTCELRVFSYCRWKILLITLTVFCSQTVSLSHLRTCR